VSAAATAAAPLRAWWRRHGLAGALLLGVLALALALRLKGVAWGLPYSFVNVDESTVLPKAFAVARGQLDPRFFYYPSLFFYMVGGLYLLATPLLWALRGANPLAQGSFVVDPGPYFLLARLLSVALGTVSVYLVYRLGRAAFGRPAGLLGALFLAVAPLHVAYSHMAVTDVAATALSLAAFWLLLEAAGGRGRRWLVAGAVAAGLATSTKYNLGLLVLPASVAGVYACRDEVRRRAGAGARATRAWAWLIAGRVYAPMLLAFVLGSPFVVLDAPRFLHDFLRQTRVQERGWLGYENAGNGFWYNLDTNLAGTLGIVLLLLALAGIALALWRRTPLDLLAAPYVVVYYAYVSTWTALADRYLLPIVPLLVLLAARCLLAAVELHPARRRLLWPAAALLLLAAVALPLAEAVRFDRGLSGTDVRLRAKSWVEANIPAGAVIASDSYGPPLVRAADAPYYREAGVAHVPYRLLRLHLPVPGEPDVRHDLGWLRARDVRYVIAASTVYDRIFAAAAQYPRVAAFYRRLDATQTLVRVFAPGPDERGPALKLYRLEAPPR
jgi:hypothetical protein